MSESVTKMLNVEVVQGNFADHVLVRFMAGETEVAEASAYLRERDGRKEIVFEAGPVLGDGEGWIVSIEGGEP